MGSYLGITDEHEMCYYDVGPEIVGFLCLSLTSAASALSAVKHSG